MPVADSTQQPPTVFLVDDDEETCESIDGLVKSLGYKLESFACAREFLQTYQPDSPGCLLLAFRLPDRNGLELYDELLRRRVVHPVIFLAGRGDASVSTVVRAFQAGAFYFFEKPYVSQQLRERIRAAVGRDAELRRQ